MCIFPRVPLTCPEQLEVVRGQSMDSGQAPCVFTWVGPATCSVTLSGMFVLLEPQVSRLSMGESLIDVLGCRDSVTNAGSFTYFLGTVNTLSISCRWLQLHGHV